MVDDVTIIGGGIAGLTMAIALKNKGINPTIFEAAPHMKAIGAGLGLGANAMMAFDRLGIKNEVMAQGRVLPAFTILDHRGKQIARTDNQAVSKKYGVNNFTIHRAALHQLLINRVGSDVIFNGKKAIDVESIENRVRITFQDGTQHTTHLLIVADGIHSVIRQKLVPGSEPRYAGYTCWRAVINRSDQDESSETWGLKGRFGIIPLANDKLYWFACINAPHNDPRMKEFTVADLQNHFENYHQPIPEILSQTSDEDLIQNDIIDLKPISGYAFGNTILIGDAAHATTPNMGQGACQAIEDAVVLAEELVSQPKLENALLNFNERRIQRTHFITNTSWRLGKVAQLENRLLGSLRNFAFRMMPSSALEKNLDKLYTVDF